MPASSSGSVFASLAYTRRAASLNGATPDPDGTLAQPFSSHLFNSDFVDDDPTQSVSIELANYSVTATPPRAPTANSPPSDPDPPSLWSSGDMVAGRYRLLEPVAAGAWGTVWKARQQGVDRYVAVKVLKSREGPSMQSARARFEREAKLASRIRHPSAVRIVEFGYEGHHPFLVMEWLDGITLGELFRSCGALSLELVLEIGAHVCAALHCAHEEGVIHRDLKPSNIMLVETSSGMTPVVVDFGLARTFEEDEPTVTRADVVIGTPAYMCPEGIRGLPLTPASDIYSLGVTLLEVLLGANPFRGESSAESMTNHLLPRVIDHEVLMAMGCSRALAELFLSMVALNLEERPLSLRSVESIFRAALDAPPRPKQLEAPPPTLHTLQAVEIAAPPVPEVSLKTSRFGLLVRNRGNVATWGLALGVVAMLLMWRPSVRAEPSPQLTSSATSSLVATPVMRLPSAAVADDVLEPAPPPAAVPPGTPMQTAIPLAEVSAPTLATSVATEARSSGSAPHGDVPSSRSAPAPSAPEATALSRSSEPPSPPSNEAESTLGFATPKAAVPSTASRSRSSGRSSAPSRSERRVKPPGTLVLTATPPGRMVVNGTDHGLRSSLMLRDLPVGSYQVRVEREGDSIRRSVHLKSGERHVEKF